MKIPSTGCNPRRLILARGEDLSKTLVHNVPEYQERGQVRQTDYPGLLLRILTLGISRATSEYTILVKL